MTIHRTRRSVAGAAIAAAAVLSLAACSGSSTGTAAAGSGGYPGTDPDSFTVLIANENPTLSTELKALAANQCSAENTALPLEEENVAQADVVQKVTLLASQNSLPAHFIAGTTMVQPEGDLGKPGLVLDYQSLLTSTGAWDDILPAASSTVESVYGGMVSLPYQYNLEGIWYNKAIFAKLGLDEPQTWDELLSDSKVLHDAGYQPFAEGGSAAWPLTRLIGMYIFRELGPDAMKKVQSGEAKLTDPGYVAAAQALKDLADAGYLGEGVTSTDADSAIASFLSGKSAMTYNGTWMLSNINDKSQNQIGADNVGFMPFPTVSGGVGTRDQWPANAGAAMAISKKATGEKVANWITCIAKNYGQQVLQDAGVLSGFKVNGDVTNVPKTTQAVQKTMSKISETVLWFEALMDSKSTSLAQSNVSLLVTGQMSAQQYMADLQDSIDANSSK